MSTRWETSRPSIWWARRLLSRTRITRLIAEPASIGLDRLCDRRRRREPIDDYTGNGLGTPNDSHGVGCNQPVAARWTWTTLRLWRTECKPEPGFLPQADWAFGLQRVADEVDAERDQPVMRVKALNFQTAYSLSNFSNTGGAQLTGTPADNDQDFVLTTADNDRPGRYYGPSLTRSHSPDLVRWLRGCPVRLPDRADCALLQPAIERDRRPEFRRCGRNLPYRLYGRRNDGRSGPGTHLGQFDSGTNASRLGALIATTTPAKGTRRLPPGTC